MKLRHLKSDKLFIFIKSQNLAQHRTWWHTTSKKMFPIVQENPGTVAGFSNSLPTIVAVVNSSYRRLSLVVIL